MKMVPLIRCSNMKEAIAFYTGVLDFQLKSADESPDDYVVNLVNGDAELQITILEGDQKAAVNVNVYVDDADALFEKYIQRGLDTSNKKGSPVHEGPTDQSWGRREFYITDASGNTLRFSAPMK